MESSDGDTLCPNTYEEIAVEEPILAREAVQQTEGLDGFVFYD